MKKLLGSDFGEFLKSYEKEPKRALRFSNKIRSDTKDRLIGEWNLKKVPWTENGYYYPSDQRPGLSVYHDAGVYYIQEPSAMSVAEAAGIKNTDAVLDLCAAPGGKTTRAAELAGFVLGNEIIPSRAKILSSNVERMGISNVIVCSAPVDRISDSLGPFFDVVIADAPCSGEGMMRKDETAVKEWSTENVERCILRQREILHHAHLCLKDGGRLVYSTCTFEPEENERQIRSFMKDHPVYLLLNEKTFYPHLYDGEGQYYAVLQKGEQTSPSETGESERRMKLAERMLTSSGVHILRSGIMKGETKTDKKKGNIYIPSHAEIMATSFSSHPFENAVNIMKEETADAFLKGNQLSAEDGMIFENDKDCFLGVYYDGYPIGLGKKVGNILKNHLPKGLRRF